MIISDISSGYSIVGLHRRVLHQYCKSWYFDTIQYCFKVRAGLHSRVLHQSPLQCSDRNGPQPELPHTEMQIASNNLDHKTKPYIYQDVQSRETGICMLRLRDYFDRISHPLINFIVNLSCLVCIVRCSTKATL